MAHGQEEGRGKGGRCQPEWGAVRRSGALAGPGQELLLHTGSGGDAAEGGGAASGIRHAAEGRHQTATRWHQTACGGRQEGTRRPTVM